MNSGAYKKLIDKGECCELLLINPCVLVETEGCLFAVSLTSNYPPRALHVIYIHHCLMKILRTFCITVSLSTSNKAVLIHEVSK